MSRTSTHPGAILREDILPATGLSVETLAQKTNIEVEHLKKILIEQDSVTQDDAEKLGKFLGNSDRFWLNMQKSHSTTNTP